MRLYLKPGDVIEAEIERIGVLRNPVISWQEGHGEPPPAAHPPVGRGHLKDMSASDGSPLAPPPRVGLETRLPRGRRYPGTSARVCDGSVKEVEIPRAVSWPRDDAKLERVRALMASDGLDALVVRAPGQRPLPDELLGHEGLRRLRLPARGRACPDLPRGLRGGRRAHRLDERRPALRRLRRGRPAAADGARARARGRGREAATRASASSSRSAPKHPTAWSASRRPSPRRGSTPSPAPPTRRRSSREARAIKTAQEVERMRLANEIAAAAMEHVRGRLEPGHDRGAGGRALAGLRPRRGQRLAGQGRAGAAVLARLVGPGHQDLHRHRHPPGRSRTSRRCSRSGSAPTATGPTTPRSSARASSRDDYAELERGLLDVYAARSTTAAPARASPSSTASSARGSPRSATPASRRTRSATASAPARTSRPTPTRPAAARSREGMVLAIEPGCYWEGGGGLRVEDNFLITGEGAEKLSPFPDGVVRCKT